jgi:hypothetical protein
MDMQPGFSTSFRVLRGAGGQWEVVEEGQKNALAQFEAPQAALSYACSIAEARHGSLVVVFDQPVRRKPAQQAHYLRPAVASFESGAMA